MVFYVGIKSVFVDGSDNGSFRNPFEFKDDYTYNSRKGSIFVISIPPNTYKLNHFYLGSGPINYDTNYSRNVTLKAGEVTYIGDFQFSPILNNRKNFIGGYCTITNKIKQDYVIFNKVYLGDFIKRNDIKIDIKKKVFKLGNYNDSTNYNVYLPIP